MRYVKDPNLPTGRVSSVIIDKNAEKAIKALENNNIKCIKTTLINSVLPPIRTHADVQVLHIGENKLLCCKEAYEYYKETMPDFDIISLKKELGEDYPNDCALNCAIIGNKAVCKVNSLDGYNCEILFVNQGYAKCSTCIIDKNAVLTSDKSIEKICKANSLDTLYIDSKGIILDGYDYGFIGGACGKLSKDVLAICGNIDSLSMASEIKSFCRNYNIYTESLCDGPVCDIGSILPITEE